MVAIETRRRLREAALLAMLAPVAACDLHPPRTADLPGNAQLLLVNPALSMVTQRQRPVSGIVASRDVLCVQPNPDWASTLSRMVQFSGSGSGSGANGSLNGTVNNSESAIQLAGRTAGVVALRDGLYSACQAYANGVIGQDAYALILSQYGDLLVALAAPSPAAAPASPAAPAAAAAKADGGTGWLGGLAADHRDRAARGGQGAARGVPERERPDRAACRCLEPAPPRRRSSFPGLPDGDRQRGPSGEGPARSGGGGRGASGQAESNREAPAEGCGALGALLVQISQPESPPLLAGHVPHARGLSGAGSSVRDL